MFVLFSACCGQYIVDVTDNLTVSNPTDGTIFGTFQLYPFPYIEGYETNKTSIGYLCYAISWQDYLDFC